MNIKGLFEKGVVFGKKNAPELLTATSVIGLITTAIWAYKAGKKAGPIIKEKKEEMELTDPEDKEAKRAVVWETVKEVTPIVVPPVLIGGVTIACIVGSNRVSNKRFVTLTAAYSLSESALKDLNGKMVEMVGEKKASDIKDAIAKEKFKKAEEHAGPERFVFTGDGDVPCIDEYTGRPFRSSYQKLGAAINTLSHRIMTEMYMSLNDFYDLVDGLERTPMGDSFGWNIDDMVEGTIPIHLTSCLSKDGTPCIMVSYDARLRTDYTDLH